jgi:hypothetical protein
MIDFFRLIKFIVTFLRLLWNFLIKQILVRVTFLNKTYSPYFFETLKTFENFIFRVLEASLFNFFKIILNQNPICLTFAGLFYILLESKVHSVLSAGSFQSSRDVFKQEFSGLYWLFEYSAFFWGGDDYHLLDFLFFVFQSGCLLHPAICGVFFCIEFLRYKGKYQQKSRKSLLKFIAKDLHAHLPKTIHQYVSKRFLQYVGENLLKFLGEDFNENRSLKNFQGFILLLVIAVNLTLFKFIFVFFYPNNLVCLTFLLFISSITITILGFWGQDDEL